MQKQCHHTSLKNCNSGEMCLLFGLVVLNPNELSDSAGREALSYPCQGDLHYWKMESEATRQPKGHFVVLADADLLGKTQQQPQ